MFRFTESKSKASFLTAVTTNINRKPKKALENAQTPLEKGMELTNTPIVPKIDIAAIYLNFAAVRDDVFKRQLLSLISCGIAAPETQRLGHRTLIKGLTQGDGTKQCFVAPIYLFL